MSHEINGGLNKSRILEVAGQVKQRNTLGQTSASFGGQGNNRNTAHFLDVAELIAAIAVRYECLYDVWADQQKETIRTAISSPSVFNMPQRPIGALAVPGDKTTNTAASINNLLRVLWHRVSCRDRLFPPYRHRQSWFDDDDLGPIKYSATANALLLHSTEFPQLEHALLQRDRPDAAEP
ncbi:hypothetical protein M407DRAFT_27015 [Tulasnella calospora MUT 4182]|uniref:Uncharacterized protein n=1 Tax=Tulasnella calospora MUT 4182 TaxID=1051891 RepID=A0A0C3Q3V3_9AGAM|nr:hypothetical protein M407DRAFT_27015 [Tulasnella calospora MUT 4182]